MTAGVIAEIDTPNTRALPKQQERWPGYITVETKAGSL